jgi:DUF3017 family protein
MRYPGGGSVWLTDAAAAEQPRSPSRPPPVPAAAHRAVSARSGSRRAHRPGSQRSGLAYLGVLCGVALSLCYLWRGPQNARAGTLAAAGLLIAAAAARLLLPEHRAGLLVSRGRLADVAVLSGLGVALLVAGLVLPPQS